MAAYGVFGENKRMKIQWVDSLTISGWPLKQLPWIVKGRKDESSNQARDIFYFQSAFLIKDVETTIYDFP